MHQYQRTLRWSQQAFLARIVSFYLLFFPPFQCERDRWVIGCQLARSFLWLSLLHTEGKNNRWNEEEKRGCKKSSTQQVADWFLGANPINESHQHSYARTLAFVWIVLLSTQRLHKARLNYRRIVFVYNRQYGDDSLTDNKKNTASSDLQEKLLFTILLIDSSQDCYDGKTLTQLQACLIRRMALTQLQKLFRLTKRKTHCRKDAVGVDFPPSTSKLQCF